MVKKKSWLIIGLILIFIFSINFYNDTKEVLSFENHYKYPWMVHKIAKDFLLLDLWEFPIMADPAQKQDFLFFLKVLQRKNNFQIWNYLSPRYLAAGFLIILREIMGKIFNLDTNMNVLPIPGTHQKSVKERLSKKDLKNNLARKFAGEKKDNEQSGFHFVYLFENEALLELSINPVHVLMHCGWVEKENGFFTARLAVYAKPRGNFGKSYLKMIMPFRRYIIYPVMMEVVKTKWLEVQPRKNGKQEVGENERNKNKKNAKCTKMRNR